MEAIDRLLATPSWARNACYIFPAWAAVLLVLGVILIISLLTLPASVKKTIPLGFLITVNIIKMAAVVFIGLFGFWICRGALATNEKFAVTCKSTGDCQSVMGLPQSGECQCGARGVCGGCVMRNNTIPQASFDAQFEPGYVA